MRDPGGAEASRDVPETSPMLPADLPSVAHDYPAAVLLIDTDADQVVYVNDLARQLAPQVRLPVSVQEWSRAAELQTAAGVDLTGNAPRLDSNDTSLGASTSAVTSLSQVAAGDPVRGLQVSAAASSEATAAREALWAIGMPLRTLEAPLRARSLLVLLPLRFPQAVSEVQASAAAGRAHQSVLAGGLAMTITDPSATDNPLIWVSPSFEQLTGYSAEQVLGRNCRFLQGPDTDPATVARLREGIAAGETTGVTLLNYRRDGSAFYNQLLVSPVFDATGTLTHHVSVQSDVTGQVLAAAERDAARAAAAHAQVLAEQAVTAQAAAEDAGRFSQLLLNMSEALTGTTTVEQVAATITDVLAPQLGAAGGGLLLADAACTRLDFVTMTRMPPDIDTAWSRIRWDEDAPVAVAVRSRQATFYRDRTALLAAHPAVVEHADLPMMGASVNLPLIVSGGPGGDITHSVHTGADVIGAVFLFWDSSYEVPAQQQVALQALARYTAQAVQRATLLADRRSTAEVLQQSLLTRLPEPDHLELRARYVPASAGEHVGGDWYDAVVLPDGATTVVIGDVAGHDITAAAKMGQVRGLLRAFAFDRQDPPAEIVGRLDRAIEGLHVDTLATLVLARIEQDDELEAKGLRRLRWTNAGHPPPILLLADGSTQVLNSAPEMLVGLVPAAKRTDQVHVLPPGCTLLLYTDGLIEHRGRSLDDGIADLRRVLSDCADCTVQDLLDHVVKELVGESPDDDTAILAVRAHPEDRPRPAEAGPNRIA